ncbi:MAG: hypothetical protein IV097_16220 [Burkholderiaceae bacterium]|nr:hypothetical protein [Burkholderiaceae bacterium]
MDGTEEAAASAIEGFVGAQGLALAERTKAPTQRMQVKVEIFMSASKIEGYSLNECQTMAAIALITSTRLASRWLSTL